ncbi:helix-turn-helix domain-containing protein [Bacillus capparidis]|uniref:Repressor LexA n=1 Tax=Bacillus capparidis TaxID=1840411 RepID=A0ABS4D1H5_9BACI|nr:S24 family peptidase [Bacillus capparidis]MBP1083475.1 repressor LexA [Bacillus capparidis]MED1094677.1 S24 family peptidase [Bacillus capparidis]
MKFTDKLDALMEEKNISKMGLSKKSGIPYTTIVNFYKKGSENIKLSTLKKLADFFEVSLDYLVDDEEEDRQVSSIELINLPLVGKVSCGNGTVVMEEIEKYEATPKEWLNGGEYFYLRAKGDSMSGARISDGDLLLIRKQADVEDGEIAAVVINEEAVLKRVYKQEGTLVLQSENPKYPPIVLTDGRVQIVGKLKKVVISF